MAAATKSRIEHVDQKKEKRKVVSSVTILVVREKFMSCKLYVHSSRAVSHGVNISYQFVVADVTTLG